MQVNYTVALSCCAAPPFSACQRGTRLVGEQLPVRADLGALLVPVVHGLPGALHHPHHVHRHADHAHPLGLL
eukprot:39832-Eustigmatos_ZCMA.PRE.1